MPTSHHRPPAPDATLLRRTLQRITTHPELWDQRRWHCGTRFCFAGHAAVLHGAVLADSHPESTWVVLDSAACRRLRMALSDIAGRVWVKDAGTAAPMVSIRDYAALALGLTERQARTLFEESNTLPDLARLVGDLSHYGPANP